MPVTVGSRAGQVVDLIELYGPLAVRHNKVHRGGGMRERHFASQREQDASRNGPRVARARPARPHHDGFGSSVRVRYLGLEWLLYSQLRKENKPSTQAGVMPKAHNHDSPLTGALSLFL